jgi:hypothetical protein
MHFLLSGLVFFGLFILWEIRPLVFGAIALAIFFIATPFYGQRANEAIILANKLSDSKAEILLQRYKHRFWGLKIAGFILLLAYAYCTTWIVWLVLPIWWLTDLVFIVTIIMYWSTAVTNISIMYLAQREERIKDKLQQN